MVGDFSLPLLVHFSLPVTPRVKGEIGEESLRAALFSALFDACLERGRPLTEEEYAALMGQVCSRGCAPSIGKEREG